MPGNGDTTGADVHAWPGADAEEVAAACASIARHLARTGVRSLGLLPVSAPLSRRRRRRRLASDRSRPGAAEDDEQVPALMLERLAGALALFVEGSVGYIGPWMSWGTAELKDGRPALLLREVGERTVEIVPPACGSAPAASAALERALASLPATITRVLVDLGGYVAPGGLPAVSDAFEGLVTVVGVRRAWRGWVADLCAKMPAQKNLGSILIG